jgi:hypothetical protein
VAVEAVEIQAELEEQVDIELLFQVVQKLL